jgi:hypothetical protein
LLDVGCTDVAALRAAVSDALDGDAQRTGRNKGSVSPKTDNLVPKLCVRECDVDLALKFDWNVDITNGTTVRDIRWVLGNSYLIRAGRERYARHQ